MTPGHSHRRAVAVVGMIFAMAICAESVPAQTPVRLSVQRPTSAVLRAPITSQAQEKRSTIKPVAIGALVGAVVGTVVLVSAYDCRSTGSMCGLGIPLYTGGGALIGGAVGYIWSRRR